MNIGIIVYSQTGNTLSVAEKVKEALTAAGHAATVARITAEGNPADGKPIRLAEKPDPSGYDAVIFASPVWAFSLCSVMAAYMGTLPSLQGKRVGCFVTKRLKQKWLGGNRAIKQMKQAAEAKGEAVCTTGIVCWSDKQREAQIDEVAARMCEVVKVK